MFDLYITYNDITGNVKHGEHHTMKSYAWIINKIKFLKSSQIEKIEICEMKS